MKKTRLLPCILSLLLIGRTLPVVLPALASEDTVGAPYAELNRGTVDKKDTATVEKTTFGGKSVLKVTPKPDGDDAKLSEIALDSFGLSGKITADYDEYRYVSIEYYYDTALPTFTGAFLLTLNNSNKVFSSGAGSVSASQPMVSGKWETAYFDVTGNIDGKLSPDMTVHTIDHVSLRPFAFTKAATMKESDVLYIGDVCFHKTNPDPNGASSGASSGSSGSSGTTATPKKEDDRVRNEGNSASPTVTYPDDISVDLSALKPYYHDKMNPGTLTLDAPVDGRTALSIALDPTSRDNAISLETVVKTDPLPSAAEYRYISVEYKFVSEASAAYSMGVYIKGTPRIFTSGGKNLTSTEPLRKGEWAMAYFVIPEELQYDLNPELDSHNLTNLHIRPLGINTKPAATHAGDVIYIGKITFSKENPDPKMIYTVTFDKLYGGAEGTLPEPLTLKKGETFTLPKADLVFPGAVFEGWTCNIDGKAYKPGDSYTVGGDYDVIFQAKWGDAAAQDGVYLLSHPDIFTEICDKKDTATARSVTVDGLFSTEVLPNLSSGADTAVILDHYGLAKKRIDLDAYKYIAVLYKYESANPYTGQMVLNFTRNNPGNGKYLFPGGGPKIPSADEKGLVTGKWDVATFAIPDLTEKYGEDVTDHTLLQFHLYPFGYTKCAELDPTDVMYVAAVIFFEDKPDAAYHTSFINGYEDGTFGISGNMTRAEACTIVARLAAGGDAKVPTGLDCTFADVTSDRWYYPYIAYCQSLGYLGSYSGAFLPNQNITRAEFVELVFNMGLLSDNGKNGLFTDVDASHPRCNVITAAGKAGLVNGYDNGDGTFSFKPDNTINRAEVVKVINNAYGKKPTVDSIPADQKMKFSDVTEDHWAYADILDAAIPHFENVRDGAERWLLYGTVTDTSVEPYTVDCAVGAAKLAELDKEFADRVAAIRATPTTVEVAGTKYYVSSLSGDDGNDGLSPEKPIASFTKLATLPLKAGDGVFFKRGDIFRGVSYQTVAGVTYSAYGEGAKPEIWGSERNYADPSLWKLTDTPNVYALTVPITNDVGLAVFDGGKAWSEKRIKGRADFKDGKLSDLDCDLCLWHDVSSPTGVSGTVYLRSDTGNPGERFSDIELAARANLFRGVSGVTVDNLSFKYTGAHAIGCGTVKNFTVTNCELGWIGGSWFRTDTLSRYGNGIEVYGGCDGYTVRNNYLYQIYDAGITHQYSDSGNNIIMKDIEYSDNLVELTSYSFEYFIAEPAKGVRHSIENCLFKHNFLRTSGFGFGDQRPDKNAAALIKGWDHWNESTDFVIEDNIFCQGKFRLLHIGATYDAWLPKMNGNTYVQYYGVSAMKFGGKAPTFDETLSLAMATTVKDENAKIFFLEPIVFNEKY